MNGVLLDLGFIQIYWYSICIVLGMIVGMFLVYKEAAKRGISDSEMTDIIFYTIVFAIIGARAYYVIFDWNYYSKNLLEIFEIWHGGLAIHGAIIFGGLFLILHTLRRKLDTLKVLDICAVGLIIGQAIGRWGNFFNQEVFGKEVSLEFLKGLFLPDFIIEGMHIDGVYHHPLFLYESLWCILGFIILLFIRRRKYTKTGQIFGLYCAWYSLGRFFLEGMRVEDFNLMLGSIKIAQVVSIIMFFVGLFFVVRRFKTSRFAHLYNDNRLSEVKESTVTTASSTPVMETNIVEPSITSDLSFQTAPVMNPAEEQKPAEIIQPEQPSAAAPTEKETMPQITTPEINQSVQTEPQVVTSEPVQNTSSIIMEVPVVNEQPAVEQQPFEQQPTEQAQHKFIDIQEESNPVVDSIAFPQPIDIPPQDNTSNTGGKFIN